MTRPILTVAAALAVAATAAVLYVAHLAVSAAINTLHLFERAL
ncbi:hypothetical protein [Pseudarthrobacter sp. NIBRBAC000502770]|nr:hypothetical protein [Pseudarthrobacter sp. NIBRBAC000502770]